MTSPPARLLVLGVDAASPDLIRRWAEDGTLPNLRALMERGLTGRSLSVEGFFVGSTWPSLYTGLAPARHGFHYLVQLEPGTYEFYRPASRGLIQGDPLWTHLSRAGKRVAVLDVPLAPLDPSLNGLQVVEWGRHDSAFGFQTSPSGVAREIFARFGAYPPGPSCDGTRRTPKDYARFVDRLVRGVEAKAELTKHLLARGPWDFFIQVFTESHCVGHQCWHLHDTAHPAHDPSVAAAIGDPLRTVYAAIDAAIGDVLAEAGEARVVVLSAHGMSHWFGAHFLLRDILFRLGVAGPPEAPIEGVEEEGGALALARSVWRRLPGPIRGRLSPLRDRIRREADGAGGLPTLGVDPRTSRCFPVGNGLAVGGIRLNLAGREPDGTLQPEYAHAFCARLTRDLKEIVDQRTGGPLVRRVLRTAERFDGELLHHLPDLLVEWSDEVPTGSSAVGDGAAAGVRAHSSKIGTVEGTNDYGRTGEHRPEGVFVAAGPGIQPGRLERELSILDYAPTFARLLGVDLPPVDGRPIEELLPDPGRRASQE
jgi:predicted AlkP superfamily phosphohydrolase/phosphomutase